jgi:protein-tyrosine phosphatase
MFSFFKKSKEYDLSWLQADMHSHILPGIDDGSPDVETSMTLLAGLRDLGLHTFIATPHIFEEIHPNSPETVGGALQRLKTALTAQGQGDVKLKAAAEYMIDDAFSSYYQDGKSLLCVRGKEVLIEMSYQFERKDLEEQIFQLQLHGYQPILAHPERYNFYHADPKMYKRLKEKGCLFQLNLLSLSGYYGEPVKKMAQNLVKEQQIDYIGTDLHHEKHLKYLRAFVTEVDVHEIVKGNPLRNMVLEA